MKFPQDVIFLFVTITFGTFTHGSGLNVSSNGTCECTNKTSESIDGRIFGKCNHKNNDKFFCYIDKKLQPDCCEENSKTFKDYCLSYDLCEADTIWPTESQLIPEDSPVSPFPSEPTFFGNETRQTVSEVSLQWIDKASMKIVWPVQGEDIINLIISKQFPDLDNACMFEGRSKSPSLMAVIIGCMDSEETIVNLSLNDTFLELMLLKNGTTLKTTWDKTLHNARTKRALNEKGGYLESSQPRPSLSGVTEEELKVPKSITFPLDLGYDKRLYNHFGSHAATTIFVQKVVLLASSFFKKPWTGLPSISFKTGNIKSYFDSYINSDLLCSNRYNTQAKRLRRGISTPLMLFVEDLHPTDGNAQSTGCAWYGAGCGNTRDEALGIVDLTWEGLTTSEHVQNMARTMAHEFGHLIGMRHDFDHDQSSGCDNTGIMSYGDPPDTWSTCSVDDFINWWRSIGFSCELSSPLPKPTPAPSCPALKSKWKCTPSRSCNWFKKLLDNLKKYSKEDQKFQDLKDFYDERKCGNGRIYCSSNGKFPRDSDILKLKRC